MDAVHQTRQKITFNPSCSDRGELATPVTLAKFGSRTFPFGVPRITVFGKLNDSARNSNDRFSRKRNDRKIDKSTFQKADVRCAYRPRFPKVYWPGAAKAALLNHACE